MDAKRTSVGCNYNDYNVFCFFREEGIKSSNFYQLKGGKGGKIFNILKLLKFWHIDIELNLCENVSKMFIVKLF